MTDHAAPEELAEAARGGLLATRPLPEEEAEGLAGTLHPGSALIASVSGKLSNLPFSFITSTNCGTMLYELTPLPPGDFQGAELTPCELWRGSNRGTMHNGSTKCITWESCMHCGMHETAVT